MRWRVPGAPWHTCQHCAPARSHRGHTPSCNTSPQQLAAMAGTHRALKRIVSMSEEEPAPAAPPKRARAGALGSVGGNAGKPLGALNFPRRAAGGPRAPQPVEALSDEENPRLAAGGSAPRAAGGIAPPAPLVAVPRAPLEASWKRGFVEVFAGSQTFTKVWQGMGHTVFPMDIKLNPEHDFSRIATVDAVWARVETMTRDCGGKPPAVHLAPPCCTYSMARWPRLRSSARPRGLPAALLTPDQKKVVKYSNRISKNAFVLMNKLAAGGVPHCFEQPVGSLLMKDLDFKSWASRWGAQRAVIDQCQFGRPYRKRTVIWGVPSGLLDGLARICPGDHVHTATLSGWGSRDRNQPTNQGSSAYPVRLCAEWRAIMLKNLGD